jgi:hypothetical protein
MRGDCGLGESEEGCVTELMFTGCVIRASCINQQMRAEDHQRRDEMGHGHQEFKQERHNNLDNKGFHL